ncbi:MAG: CRISPR-associated helicase Cas3' [Akkermansiaceae bacterium]|nr:CRISPR-associated helicase Cas3' [Akkermansiaceae bacterium]
MNTVYAHTKENSPIEAWEPLYGDTGHAERTTSIALRWGAVFAHRLKDADKWLRALAMYHDMGKAKTQFQQYLLGKAASVSHKQDAAAFFLQNEGCLCSRLLAYAFMGHHGGLQDGIRMFNGELVHYPIDDEVIAAMPQSLRQPEALSLPVTDGATNEMELSVVIMLLVRMLHSCLVDADWLATEEFMQPERALARNAGAFLTLGELSERLEEFLLQREQVATGRINMLRKQIHSRCYQAAEAEPGCLRLNVPTGGGKTLSSLSYALKHASVHGLDRVIYVIPYTSIIEQTADEFRAVLGAENVVEHHSSVAEETESEHSRYATENWEAPLIVTTSVQFFESLYAARNKRCRKIHNIARSVIVFDEVQSLPPHVLSPCLAVLRELQRGYGCSLLLCTATQPAFENEGVFTIGWKPGELRSLLGVEFEHLLAAQMKRVQVQRLGAMRQPMLVEHFMQLPHKSALFIVNLTREAQALFELLRASGAEGLFHLSARMCPAHRRKVLAVVRQRLQKGEPVVLVSTRVVEAGVDVSFPVVYRARCGLDSLAQSAGRCNRHGEADLGQVFAYEAAESEFELPGNFVEMRNAAYALEDVVWGKEEADIFSPELVDAYFRMYYSRMEAGNKWDSRGIMATCLQGMRSHFVWDFVRMAADFRMIDDAGRSLLMPFGEDAEKLRVELLALQRIGAMPTREMYRRVQQFSVTVYEGDWKKLSKDCIHSAAEIYMLDDPGMYDMEMGLLRSPDEEKIYVL